MAPRAEQAHRRLAAMREADKTSTPKAVWVVHAALMLLLANRPVRPREISVSELADLTGEEERDVQRALGWMRDNLIISRPWTKGGKGHSGPVQYLTDEQAAQILRDRADAIDKR